jgi:competence protein ComFC
VEIKAGFSNKLVDWLFPPSCVSCGMEGFFICPECLKKIKVLESPMCELCGSFVRKQKICERCARRKISYEHYYGFAQYTGVMRDALLSLKYRHNFAIASLLVDLAMGQVTLLTTGIDLIVPVPTSKVRKRLRGYNQAEMISRALAKRLTIEHDPNCLTRVREDGTQTKLDVQDRYLNVLGVFKADPRLVTGKAILLVDDVYTTGATVNEASNTLVKSGADSVNVFTMAKTI